MADLVGLVIFLPIWVLKAFFVSWTRKIFHKFPHKQFVCFFFGQKLLLGPMCEPLMSFGNGRSMELTRNKIESDNKKKLNWKRWKWKSKKWKWKGLKGKGLIGLKGMEVGEVLKEQSVNVMSHHLAQWCLLFPSIQFENNQNCENRHLAQCNNACDPILLRLRNKV